MKTFFIMLIATLFARTAVQAQPGSPDKSFGEGGTVLDTSIWADCRAMAMQPDGKILTGGYTYTYSDNPYTGGLYIARFNKDGSADKEFGVKGKVIIRNIEGIQVTSTQAIAIQPDGKIIACGKFIPIPFHSYGSVGLLRLYPDGRLDSSFGVNGFVTTTLSKEGVDVIGGMALQPDGRIVVAGNKHIDYYQPGPDFLLRYMPDGSPDDSFGEKGVVLTNYTDNVTLGTVELQPDGKILTGGIYGSSVLRFQVARYNRDGSLDDNFGEGGFARLTAKIGGFSFLNDLTVQPDGKIVAAGKDESGTSIALARFESTGKPDMSFGDQGAYTYLYRSFASTAASSVFITKENKIMLTGEYRYDAGHQVAAFRYTEDGTLDSSFGENGIASGGFPKSKHGSDFGSGVGILQADGKVIVSGSFEQNDGSTYNVALFRFNGDNNNKQPLMVRIKRWLLHHGISWQVQQSKDVRYYAVQRSADGIVYKEIARLSNKAQVDKYEDAATINGSSYYRLAAIGWDNSRTYSNTVLIDESANVKVFPNPVRDNLQLQGLSGKTSVSIVDLQGNVRSSSVAGGASYSVNTSQLTPGNYLLKLQHNSTTTTQPFVKE